jgi:hypothetical protein
METYIVSCGNYDWNHIAYVTNDFDSAIVFISERLNADSISDKFEDMECWNNGKQVYTYGSWNGDTCNYKKQMTPIEVKQDIERHRKNVDY